MTILVTGSSGHLGEAIVRTLRQAGRRCAGLDIEPSDFTAHVGSITDRTFVARAIEGAEAVIHTATLHKPHIATHSRQDFVDTNITGTLNLLEEAVAARVTAFVFTSTTSVFGRALQPPPDGPAAWITEDVTPVPRNIYGVTKAAAEDLCALFSHRDGLPAVVLRTSRFFPEEDDSAAVRAGYADANIKANEFLHRRVDIADAADAHLLALDRAATIGFGRYIISATTPFEREDLSVLRRDAPAVVRRHLPAFEALYAARGWTMYPGIDRVYVNARARADLGWRPAYDFKRILDRLAAGEDMQSPLARAIGIKRYHAETFDVGPYPTE